MRFKYGFTLAEVLITLGIIGVVAALTMPVLINKHRSMVLRNQFKAAHSLLTSATKLLVAEDISPYNVSTNVRVDLGERTKAYAKVMNGTILPQRSLKLNPKNLTGKRGAHVGAISDKNAISLNNGMVVLIGFYNWIFVDINGSQKPPNRSGYDWHTFKITENDQLLPVTDPAHDTRPCTYKNQESTDVYLGYGCTEYAISDISPDGGGDYWYDFLYRKK